MHVGWVGQYVENRRTFLRLGNHSPNIVFADIGIDFEPHTDGGAWFDVPVQVWPPDMSEVSNALGATYCLTGDVEIFGSDLAISVELSDTRDGRIVWGEGIFGKVDDAH